MRICVSDQGFTLLELLIVMSILTIFLAASAPSVQGLLDARKVDRLATKLSATLELARSEAIRTNANIYIYNLGMSSETDSNWCVIVTADSSSPSTCSTTSTALGVIDSVQFPALNIRNNSLSRWFDPARGIINQAMTYTLKTDSMTSGQMVKVIVSNKSRIRQCAEGSVNGYKPC